jgi:isopentenyldiphosphate isomerase
MLEPIRCRFGNTTDVLRRAESVVDSDIKDYRNTRMIRPHPTDERIWLVTKNDEPIGEGWQPRDSKKNWQNFRVVNAFVKNKEGKFWIPRRGPHKRIFPNCLDMSMGGHVDWPETYEQAFERETLEELNVDVRTVRSHELGYLTPAVHPALSACMKVWEIEMEIAPMYNPDDFTESFWLTPQEFHDRIVKGDKAKGDLAVLIKLFYG